MATLICLSLSGMAPAYLAANGQLVSDKGRRQLHFANTRTCVIRRTYTSFGLQTDVFLLFNLLSTTTLCLKKTWTPITF